MKPSKAFYLVIVSLAGSACGLESTRRAEKANSGIHSGGCHVDSNLALIFFENYIDQMLREDHLEVLAKMSVDELSVYVPEADKKLLLSIWQGLQKLQIDNYARVNLKNDAMHHLATEAAIDRERLKALVDLTKTKIKQTKYENKLFNFQHILGANPSQGRLTQKDLLTVSREKLNTFKLGETIQRFHGGDPGKIQGFFKRNPHLKSFRTWIKGQAIASENSQILSFQQLAERIIRQNRQADGRVRYYPFGYEPTAAGYRQLVIQYLAGNREHRVSLERYTIAIYEAFMQPQIESITDNHMAETFVRLLPFVKRLWDSSLLKASNHLRPEIAGAMPLAYFLLKLITHPSPTSIYARLANHSEEQAYFLIQLAFFDIFVSPGPTLSRILPHIAELKASFEAAANPHSQNYGGQIIPIQPAYDYAFASHSVPQTEELTGAVGPSFLKKVALVSSAVGLVSTPAWISLAVLLPDN